MTASTSSARQQVDYNAHLLQTAVRSTWTAIVDNSARSIGIAVGVFTAVLGIAWYVELNQAANPTLVAVSLALTALLLCYLSVFLAHVGYLTPKKFLIEKQKQLLEERTRFSAALGALDSRLANESTDRVTVALDRLTAILKPRSFTNLVAGLYDAGAAELEPPELDELCRQLAKRQLPHPFANIPDGADYWMWLLQSALERGVHLRTQKDVMDYHKAVELESAPSEPATTPAPAPASIKSK